MSSQPSGGGAILLVEDDCLAAATLRAELTSLGYYVRLAASADAALAAFDVMRVDLVLVSLILPDTNGLILCSNLRAHTRAPIIVLSARPREVDRLLALELGANDFLTKPVDVDDLLARMEAALFDQTRLERLARSS